MRNSILGALFTMGTVETLPSIEVVIAPQINEVYVIFMTLPFLLAVALCCVMCCNQDRSEGIPTTSYHMLLWGNEDHANVKIPERYGNSFPSNVNNRLVFQQSKLEDGTKRGVMTICRDPRRFLYDWILKVIITNMLHRMENNDQRKIWVNNCITHQNHGVPPWVGLKWDANMTQKVHARLEFLDPSERCEWLAFVICEGSDMASEDSPQGEEPNRPNAVDLAHTSSPTTMYTHNEIPSNELDECARTSQKIQDDCTRCCWGKQDVNRNAI